SPTLIFLRFSSFNLTSMTLLPFLLLFKCSSKIPAHVPKLSLPIINHINKNTEPAAISTAPVKQQHAAADFPVGLVLFSLWPMAYMTATPADMATDIAMYIHVWYSQK